MFQKPFNGYTKTQNETDLASSSSPGGIFRSMQRMTWLALRLELSAMTPAISSTFIVRSRWSNDVDSGRHSASAMAPAEGIEVDDKNNRFRAVVRVNAVR